MFASDDQLVMRQLQRNEVVALINLFKQVRRLSCSHGRFAVVTVPACRMFLSACRMFLSACRMFLSACGLFPLCVRIVVPLCVHSRPYGTTHAGVGNGAEHPDRARPGSAGVGVENGNPPWGGGSRGRCPHGTISEEQEEQRGQRRSRRRRWQRGEGEGEEGEEEDERKQQEEEQLNRASLSECDGVCAVVGIQQNRFCWRCR